MFRLAVFAGVLFLAITANAQTEEGGSTPRTDLFSNLETFLHQISNNIVSLQSTCPSGSGSTAGIRQIVQAENAKLQTAIVGAINSRPSQPVQSRVHAYPYDCSDIKRQNPYARSGTYQISLTGNSGSQIPVYCDLAGRIGWTKVLQILDQYEITTSASGDVSTSSLAQSGKLSDSVINAIAGNLVHAHGYVYYRLTARGTTDRVFVRNPKVFDDTKVAWNLFNGARRQCFNPDLDSCSWFQATHQTLDTGHDGSGGVSTRRFFTDHDGASNPTLRCYSPRSADRCVSQGQHCNYCVRRNIELWVGY